MNKFILALVVLITSFIIGCSSETKSTSGDSTKVALDSIKTTDTVLVKK